MSAPEPAQNADLRAAWSGQEAIGGGYLFICEWGHQLRMADPNLDACPAPCFKDDEGRACVSFGTALHRSDCRCEPCGEGIDYRMIDYEPLQIDGSSPNEGGGLVGS